MFGFTASPSLSLYIHFPWCVRKCPYCDFNSHTAPQTLPQAEYIDALLRDVESELPRIWGRNIETIFMGGGTPSLFSAEQLDRLLSSLRALLNLKPEIEITLEANPGTVEQQRFAEYRQVGINRLSLGIQSFDDDQLQRLGRIHNAAEAHHAIDSARAAGFDNFNLDLMFALPQQESEAALRDLKTAIEHEPSHLSYYQLTIEPNTLFHHSPPSLPDDDAAWDIQEQGHALLAEHGYAQYEISAFAKPSAQCRHNLNYWRFGDYLGIGAGAHDKITHVPDQSITRSWKQKHPLEYMQSAGTPAAIGDKRQLDRHDAGFEFFLNALRLTDGFALTLFEQNTGLSLSPYHSILQQAENDGLIERDLHHLRPTTTGRRFLNELLQRFLPEDRHAD